jgi:hypothetical protein
MYEKQFLKTMIETIKYDDEIINKDELLGILRYSLVTFRKTGAYTHVQDQRQEYLDLRVPIPMLKTAKEHKEIFFNLANDIYVSNDDYDLYGLAIKPKLIELEGDNATEHDVVFDEIKETIIQGIRNAKYIIWVAVAWFTDKDIFQELIAKKKHGVSIRIITSDEKSNIFLMGELEANFEVIKVPLKGAYLSNRLQDKFRIIDFIFVMHGSYNWSKAAQYNDETLATALDKDFVKKFADEFMRLYTGNSDVEFDW